MACGLEWWSGVAGCWRSEAGWWAVMAATSKCCWRWVWLGGTGWRLVASGGSTVAWRGHAVGGKEFTDNVTVMFLWSATMSGLYAVTVARVCDVLNTFHGSVVAAMCEKRWQLTLNSVATGCDWLQVTSCKWQATSDKLVSLGLLLSDQIHRKCNTSYIETCTLSHENMIGKQERKARPRINLEKEGKKCASAETESVWKSRLTPGAVPTCGFLKPTGNHTLVRWMKVSM